MFRKLGTAVLAVLVFGVGTARAGSIVYSLNSTEVVAFGAGPYGSVTLTDNGGNVDFVVDLALGFKFLMTGNENSHALFALNGTGVAVADIVNISNSTASVFQAYAPSSGSPFGDFLQGIRCTTCGQGGQGATPPPLTFTVNGATIGDFASLSTSGSPNAYFTADVIWTATGATGQVGATNPGTDVPDVTVPDGGATLTLLGCALVGLGALRRKYSA